MFNCDQDPLTLLIELTPKLAKKRYRQSIFDAWDCKCGYCNEPATSLDHIIPRFRSGSSNRHNLIPACRRCNTNKASAKMEDWYQQQEFYNEVRLSRIKAWMSQDVIDIFVYNVDTNVPKFAAG
jgi:5-methylcytosine-specific restriction endonuclease McrA